MITLARPRPAPIRASARQATFASLSTFTGRSSRSVILTTKGTFVSGTLIESATIPRRWSIWDGSPKPTAATGSSPATRRTSCSISSRSRFSSETSVGAESRARSSSSGETSAAFTDVPPRSTPTTGPKEEFIIVGTIKRRDGARVEAPKAVQDVSRGPGRRDRRRRRRALRLHRTVRTRGRARPRADARGPAGARHAPQPRAAARPAGGRAAAARRAGRSAAGILPAPLAADPGDRDPRPLPALRLLALHRL